MPDLYLTRGLPGSGKTVWATDYVMRQNTYEGGLKCINVNRDDIRAMLFGSCQSPHYDFKNNKEKMVTEVSHGIVDNALKNGVSVVVSDTNLNEKTVKTFRHLAEYYEANFALNDDFLKVPVGVCIERDKMREKMVGEKIIMGMYDRYRNLFPKENDMEDYIHPPRTFELEHSVKYVPDKTLNSAFIFDIDGTLANMTGHRGPFDEHKYHLDDVYADVAWMMDLLYRQNIFIIVLTGREGTQIGMENTKNWLAMNDLKYDHIFFRKEGDTRKDSIVKKELFFTHVAPQYNCLGVFDDRTQVVKMWRDIGVRCYQVFDHNF